MNERAAQKMGNTKSKSETLGVKAQAEGTMNPLYSLLDLSGVGGGYLLEEMKRSLQVHSYDLIDEALKVRLKPYLYNGGKGRKVSFAEMVLLRNLERPPSQQIEFNREIKDENLRKLKNCELENLKTIQIAEGKFREVCWDLKQRGSGETCLHICLLCATSVHAALAKRMLKLYPKLINDIYISDEYYGENVLHMAIVNEDPSMVKFLLDNGVNCMEACSGNFFTPEDQKSSRKDLIHQEKIYIAEKTDYVGYIYMGEYPHCFAACLGQVESLRLILSKGVDPNTVDTNGNTVLHIMVIKNKIEMFDMAFELGASTTIVNRRGLTTLTLAAQLARKQMFFHILNINRDVYWRMGGMASTAFPLEGLDTINQESGSIDLESALNLIVFGDNALHLNLLEGVVVDLLKTKWKTFVKSTFYRQFLFFVLYFCLTLVHSLTLQRRIDTALNPGKVEKQNANATLVLLVQLILTRGSSSIGFDFLPGEIFDFQLITHAMRSSAAIGFIIQAAREAHFLGPGLFSENMMRTPSRILFLSTCFLVITSGILATLELTAPWLRTLTTITAVQDLLEVAIMLGTAPHFLFFCRGVKIVGPFVIMIYRMIKGDLLRFVTIYAIFAMGFSQAYFVMFRSYKTIQTENTTLAVDCGVESPMQDPIASLLSMFIMSLNKFDETVCHFDRTDHPITSSLMFMLYMVIAALLLMNMLIAMMGTTYQIIAEQKNEWIRQWARIVLIVERGVSPTKRLQHQRDYSELMNDGKLALVLRLKLNKEELAESIHIGSMKKRHNRRARPLNDQSINHDWNGETIC